MNWSFTSPGVFCALLVQKKRSAINFMIGVAFFLPAIVIAQNNTSAEAKAGKSVAPSWISSAPQQNSTTNFVKQPFKTIWKAKPFDNQVFIENRGKFDEDLKIKKKPLFEAVLGDGLKAYFFPNGVLYHHVSFVLKDNDEDKE